MIAKKPNEIFSYISHVIFAIIIATTYDTATHVFMNAETPFLSNHDSLISSIEILLVYVTVISGWVGYSRSMIKWPHKNTKLGTFRFSLDIAILFCYFGLITSTQPQNEFQDYFLSWIITLFVLFLIWDLLKILEYYEKGQTTANHALWRSFFKTFVFFAVFLSISYVTMWLSEYKIRITDDNAVYVIILLLTIALLLLYRYFKWSIRLESLSFDEK